MTDGKNENLIPQVGQDLITFHPATGKYEPLFTITADQKIIGMCKDCEHYQTLEWYRATNYKTKSRTNCMSGKFLHTYDDDNAVPDGGWFYADWDTRSAELLVGPDFGCIHWERKKDE